MLRSKVFLRKRYNQELPISEQDLLGFLLEILH